MSIIALIGKKNEGKTTWMENAFLALREQGWRVGGVLQPAIFVNGLKMHYALHILSTGEQVSFAIKRKEGDGYDFRDQGWALAESEIFRSASQDEILMIDELGNLEAQGRGHFPAIQKIALPARAHVILSCRDSAAGAMARHFGSFDACFTPKDHFSSILNYFNA